MYAWTIVTAFLPAHLAADMLHGFKVATAAACRSSTARRPRPACQRPWRLAHQVRRPFCCRHLRRTEHHQDDAPDDATLVACRAVHRRSAGMTAMQLMQGLSCA